MFSRPKPRSSSSAFAPWMSPKRAAAEGRAGPVVGEPVVVGQQRVHPVDGDEVLGQRVRHPVVVRHGLRDADAGVAVDQPEAQLVQPVVRRRPVPVAPQAHVDDLGAEDRRRPLHGVDLGDQRGHDQPRRLVDPLVAPVLVVGAQLVAEQVVLAGEQRVQPAESQPPALVEAGDLEALGVLGQVPVEQPQLRALAQLAALGLVGAVHLGPVPPGRGAVREQPGSSALGLASGNGMLPAIRICRSGCAAGRVRPGHAVRQRHVDIGLAERVAGVVHPVVHLELDPRRGQQVQRQRRAGSARGTAAAG